MSYYFTPLSDEQLENIGLIEDGTYDFEIVHSDRKISEKGNNMAALQINVLDTNGISHLIYDYLVFSNVPLNIRKVKHFCDAVGLEDHYKKGEIPDKLDKLCGKVQIGIKESTPNSQGGLYPRKNIVIDYIKRDKNKFHVKEDNFFNDKIPF